MQAFQTGALSAAEHSGANSGGRDAVHGAADTAATAAVSVPAARTGPCVAGIRLRGPFFLAPVAGYSDAAFRSVCFDYGAALCYTEMVSSEALSRGHPKTRELLERAENETEYAIQLFGANPSVMGKAAAMAAAWKPLFLDLNCGCPVPKIVRTGAGSALMKTPARIGQIVHAMREESGLPVTVKIRLGWDESAINYEEAAAIAVEAGAAAVTLHARTRAQQYSGQADWQAIARLAASLSVPVFGSGDLFSADDALRMLRETRCAGAMLARGAMGNPFIFSRAQALWRAGRIDGLAAPDAPSYLEVAQAAQRHLALSVQFLGERTACVEFRKQFCAYTKGLPYGAPLRERAVRCSSQAEFEALLRELAAAGRP